MTQANEHLKKTPLFEYYQKNEVQLTDFNGWALPIQFTKLQQEHQAVRTGVGLFETSHMGEIMVTGEGATTWLNTMLSNDLTQVAVNQAQYTLILNGTGGIIDDLIVYKLDTDRYFFTPNASNTEAVLEWFNQHNSSKAILIQDVSQEYGLIAIQGPDAEAVLSSLTSYDLTNLKPYHFAESIKVGSIENILLSRTGYTGEDGFELYIKWSETESLWMELLEAGESYHIRECGLGARDTLRLEAGMSLYGHELSQAISPLEAGVGFAVKLKKSDAFIGQEALLKLKQDGVKKISRGFELQGKGIARQDYLVLNLAHEPIGKVTSGTQSPTFNKALGMMLIDRSEAEYGNQVLIQIRKKVVPAIVTKKDWLKRGK